MLAKYVNGKSQKRDIKVFHCAYELSRMRKSIMRPKKLDDRSKKNEKIP